MVKTEKTTGIGFTGLLTLVFIVLKLIGKIEWSWLWVLSPLWIAFAIYMIGLVVAVICTISKETRK